MTTKNITKLLAFALLASACGRGGTDALRAASDPPTVASDPTPVPASKVALRLLGANQGTWTAAPVRIADVEIDVDGVPAPLDKASNIAVDLADGTMAWLVALFPPPAADAKVHVKLVLEVLSLWKDSANASWAVLPPRPVEFDAPGARFLPNGHEVVTIDVTRSVVPDPPNFKQDALQAVSIASFLPTLGIYQ